MNWMYSIAQLVSLPWMWAVFAALLLIVFFYCVCSHWNKFKAIEQDLKRAAAQLPRLGRDGLSEDQHRQKQQRFFYENFEDVSTEVGNIASLSHAWHEFVESTFYGVGESDRRVVYVSHPPSHYFHRDSVLGARINLLQFMAFPNYLIGLGLLLTFLGIAAALQVAQAGLAAEDGGQQAMRELLAVASTKFISSLFGILLSLLLSFWQRTRLKDIQRSLDDFCERLELCTEYKSTAKLLYDNNEEQRRHTLALNSMATNIADGIGTVLSNQLPSSVANALEPLAVEIRGLAQKFSSSNENALQNVLEEFLNQMRKSTGDDMDALMGSMRTLKSSLDELVERMQSMGENFGSETRASSARMTDAIENFSASFVPVQHGITHFASSLSSLETMAARIEQAGGSISGAANLSHESMSQFAGTVGDISSHIAPLQALLQQMTEALVKMTGTADQLESAGRTIALAANGFRSSSESMVDAGGRFQEKVQIFERVADGISGTVTTLERASGHVSTASAPLSDLSRGMINALQQLQETEKRIQQSNQELKNMLNGLEKFSELIPTLWEQYEHRFRQVDGDLAKAFNELTTQSDVFHSSVRNFVEQLDDTFTKSLQGLSGAIQELTEEREQSLYEERPTVSVI